MKGDLMPLQDKTTFIPDPEPEMTIRDKNLHLSAILAVAPLATKQIVVIERIEIGASGWRVIYRTGTP
jgi:hypothetical protein